MNRRRLLSALAGAGAAGLAGCVSSESAPGTGTETTSAAAHTPGADVPDDADAPTDGYVAGNTDFGLALLDRLAEESPTENRFVSPYSIGVALAMTYAGARGETRTEMAETMRFRPTGEDLHRAVAALRADLPLTDPDEAGSGTTTEETTATAENADDGGTTENSDRGTTEGGENTTEGPEEGAPFRLVGANALWGHEGFPFREGFLQRLERHYGAGLGRVDFRENPDGARRAINAWVADRTRGKVPELFPEGTIDRRTRLVLANAVYFRANWADTFDAEATEPETFTALDGTTDEVPTMRQQERFPFAEVDGVKVLELPYAGGDTDMALLLPPRERFREFERGLDADRLGDLLDATETREVAVRLPRFEFRSSLELGERLKAMGMTTAFAPAANFGGMAEGDAGDRLRLGSVMHEAYVRVDEQGTEAAAATGVEVELTSAAPDPAEFVADRPFLFAVRHRPTGAVLFLGRVADAAAAD